VRYQRPHLLGTAQASYPGALYAGRLLSRGERWIESGCDENRGFLAGILQMAQELRTLKAADVLLKLLYLPKKRLEPNQ
jgi:hypothetical protein